MSSENLLGTGTHSGASEIPSSRTERIRNALDDWFDRASEWLNPILIKEARQAFKSRQFLVTFTLLLTCSWVWSMFALAIRSPGIFYVPGGKFLLAGYLTILIFPLTIIIPFSAFRSLAAEREDGTYELLSISTLRPRQIILGKMCSGMLQLLIYLSVLAPCMTFTYLLRGVDIAEILFYVFYGVIICWVLVSMGLMLATLHGPRHWQIFSSVCLILFLAFIWFTITTMSLQAVSSGVALDLASLDFWVANGAVVTMALAIGTMSLLAAMAGITPRSENRSTALRVGMLVCQLLNFFWFRLIATMHPDPDIAPVYVIVTSAGWAIFGSLMIGEDPLLSPRIRRGLPKTVLGRIFLTLFCPGPGTGYLFATSNLLVMFMGCMLLMGGSRYPQSWRYLPGCAGCVFYLIIYLGITRLILRAISRRTNTGPVMGLLTCLILVGLTAVLSMTIQFTIWTDDYTLVQLPNALWTIGELMNGNSFAYTQLVLLILSVGAIGVFLINLLRLKKQLLITHTLVPVRVLADDAEKSPAPAPVRKRTSPWDDDPIPPDTPDEPSTN